MKTKGISIWEQHLERIVLGIAILVFIALTALQFVGDPNATMVNGEPVSADEVDELVKVEAERLLGRLSSDARPMMVFEDPDPIFETFEQQRLAGVTPMPGLPQVQTAVVLGNGDLGVAIDTPFDVPVIPAPYRTTSAQYFDAISVDSSELLEQESDLKAMVAELPHDLTWITAAAQFDIAKVLAQYQATDAEGQQEIPTNWYNGRVDILDVRVEREEYIDGQWTNQTLLAPIPGQYTFRESFEDQQDMDAASRDWVLQIMSDPTVAHDIVRPEFYPLVNASWSPPVYVDETDAPATELTEQEMEIRDLKKSIVRAQKDLARLLAKLEEAGGELYPDKPTTGDKSSGPGSDRGSGGGTSAPGGGMSSGGLGGGGGMGRGENTADDSERRTKLRIQLTKQRDRKQQRLDRFQERLTALQGDMADTTAQEVEEEPQDTIMVWAHDMTVEPGKTYRYRFTIDVFNPFCARRINLIEEQHELAEGLVLQSASSEWSEPLYAEPPLRVFITGATAPGQGPAGLGGLDLGTLNAQVYRFYDSRWWLDDVRVSPGDRIGGVKELRGADGGSIEIDFSSDWFVLDVVSDVTANRTARDRRYAAKAILQNLYSPEMIVVRFPARDAGSEERLQLKEEVDLADQSELALNQ
jgi:uncharacterized membrane protein YgcG/uncharacterized protein YggL (DUF469 family)